MQRLKAPIVLVMAWSFGLSLVVPGLADAGDDAQAQNALFAVSGAGYTWFSPAAASGAAAASVATATVQTERTGYPVVDWALETFVDGASVTLGIGVRRSSFTVTRKSDHASGTIVDRDYPAVFFVYSTKPTLFPDSRFGYTFMFRLSSFNMDRQVTTGTPGGGSASGVRSNIRGMIGYAVPSLYYQWGDQSATGTYFVAGVGVGLVASSYGGTMQLNTPAGLETVDLSERSYSLDPAWGTFIEARWRHTGIYLGFMRAQMPGTL